MRKVEKGWREKGIINREGESSEIVSKRKPILKRDIDKDGIKNDKLIIINGGSNKVYRLYTGSWYNIYSINNSLRENVKA